MVFEQLHTRCLVLHPTPNPVMAPLHIQTRLSTLMLFTRLA